MLSPQVAETVFKGVPELCKCEYGCDALMVIAHLGADLLNGLDVVEVDIVTRMAAVAFLFGRCRPVARITFDENFVIEFWYRHGGVFEWQPFWRADIFLLEGVFLCYFRSAPPLAIVPIYISLDLANALLKFVSAFEILLTEQ